MQDLRFDDGATLARQLAGDLAGRMRKSIELRGRVCVAVSGGSTPVAFFEALAQEVLPWDKVLITLVDDRWVDDTHDASNAALVKNHLLKNNAASAYFLPLKNKAANPVDGFMACENALQEQIVRLDYAVLGLGLDGHTASWFPGSKALPALLSESGNARCCPVTDAPVMPQRMSLTWSFLAACRHLFLHFEGADKNAVFLQAKQAEGLADRAAMPVRTLLSQSAVPLSIYRTEG
ncbi:6-phosphogluconolactonase [Thalassolituus sp. LLYu03]|uniref:6-phosphogluconolactonase n=1 Tax=Thalassolituus sp. LLYu03 TaxID=3421656 RepID=UPI003D2CB6F7